MGSMHNSVDAVDDMISSISACVQGLRDASQNISTAAHGDWEDEVSQAYSDQMQKIAKLVKAAIEKYSGIHF